MDKLRRVLSGNESPDEESGIMSQVKPVKLYIKSITQILVLVR